MRRLLIILCSVIIVIGGATIIFQTVNKDEAKKDANEITIKTVKDSSFEFLFDDLTTYKLSKPLDLEVYTISYQNGVKQEADTHTFSGVTDSLFIGTLSEENKEYFRYGISAKEYISLSDITLANQVYKNKSSIFAGKETLKKGENLLGTIAFSNKIHNTFTFDENNIDSEVKKYERVFLIYLKIK
ncbi:hypothetical protein [Brochothrix thermosphacta]|uniref:Uncharacterized protein n=1 Tax=Brochothrix thermosphacta TaxID=2756 RepID=A0A1D2L0Q1_BROTH|nr:hypothetical protein [Brochothrix thermosphacta]ATF25976.1 hypothetical protein CNY62_05920 [Brochothrix thermosphacta]ATH85316.1 hypothetical protein CPF12_05510 [Brochothrix thermosphacta]MPQ28969.1 hypothetical protein [Brochothrix thermosphacta]ODJ63437.1 hypothetical protein BFR36_03640 [Brochothrix thermosphacta]ODJ69116.1 hypothetical protein BFR39_07820 [Brochothrix thermosphacta]